MKTIKEYIEAFPEPYRTQAFDNTGHKELNKIARGPYEALDAAFPWDATPQKHEYWWGFANHLLIKEATERENTAEQIIARSDQVNTIDEGSGWVGVCLKYGSANDPVNHPDHYNKGKIEVIDFIEDQKLGYHLGNTVKYVARAGKKDASKEIEDLEKAKWYLERKIKQLKNV